MKSVKRRLVEFVFKSDGQRVKTLPVNVHKKHAYNLTPSKDTEVVVLPSLRKLQPTFKGYNNMFILFYGLWAVIWSARIIERFMLKFLTIFLLPPVCLW